MLKRLADNLTPCFLLLLYVYIRKGKLCHQRKGLFIYDKKKLFSPLKSLFLRWLRPLKFLPNSSYFNLVGSDPGKCKLYSLVNSFSLLYRLFFRLASSHFFAVVLLPTAKLGKDKFPVFFFFFFFKSVKQFTFHGFGLFGIIAQVLKVYKGCPTNVDYFYVAPPT